MLDGPGPQQPPPDPCHDELKWQKTLDRIENTVPREAGRALSLLERRRDRRGSPRKAHLPAPPLPPIEQEQVSARGLAPVLWITEDDPCEDKDR